MRPGAVLICEGSDLLLFYLIVGEFLLVLLPVLASRRGLSIGASATDFHHRVKNDGKGEGENSP